MQRVWMVTGSSRGLGRAIVHAAARSGDLVVATTRRPADLAELVRTYPGSVAAVALDITDPAAAPTAVDAALERFGRLDVVVNNAGHADLGSIEDTPDESFWQQHAVSYAGLVHVTRAALPVLRSQARGHFIQISSLGARMGTPGLASYQAAKAAATTFSLSLAAEVAPFGLKVSIVEPGNMRTENVSGRHMTVLPLGEGYEPTVGVSARYLDSLRGQQPGDPDKAARVIVQLTRMDAPPLRLALGADAVVFAAVAGRRLTTEDDRWRDLGASIAFLAAGSNEAKNAT